MRNRDWPPQWLWPPHRKREPRWWSAARRIERNSARRQVGRLKVGLEDVAQIAGAEQNDARVRNIASVLEAMPGSLFTLVDAARDTQVLRLLTAFGGGSAVSLFEGEAGRKLAPFAPYLVGLPSQSMLLRALLEQGWGMRWGIFVSGYCELEEARAHLRSLLLVRGYDGKPYYFRFYDPSVWRAYVPSCQLEELGSLFGPLRSVAAEGEDPGELLLFNPTARQPRVVCLEAAQ